MGFKGIRGIDNLLRVAKYYSYNIPNSLSDRIADFYLLSRYSNENISDIELKESLNIAIKELIPILKEYFLSQLFDAIVGEAAVFTQVIGDKKDPLYKVVRDKLQGMDLDFSYHNIRQVGYEYFNQFSKEEVIKNLQISLNKQVLGKVYAKACNYWLLLNNAATLSDIITAIDSIIDLEHNAGSIFERFPSINVNELKGIKNLIHTKSLESTDFWALYEKASSSLKPMIAAVIKSTTGKGYDLYSPKEFTLSDKKKSIKYIEELLNFLNAKAMELLDTIADPISAKNFIDEIEKFSESIFNNIRGIRNQEDFNKYESLIYNKLKYIEDELKKLEI